MSFNFEIQGGKSYNLPVGGKYCAQDIVITATGGGAEINAITASSLPAAVTDGQIVVITDIPAGNFLFSYDTPENPASGDVWIHTVDSDGYSFTIGGITISPGATMQYSGSEWDYRNAYIGINGAWKMFSTQSPLASLTWEQIIAIANSGEDPSLFFEIGDERKVAYGGTEILTAVIGAFRHNTITGTTKKAAIAFTLKECLSAVEAMNGSATNAGGWNGSVMRANINSYHFDRFPAELTAAEAIKYVNVVASSGGGGTALTTSSDRLRLHSITELGLSYAPANTEGETYAYYSAGNRIKTVNGSAAEYWTRSGFNSNTSHFAMVTATGTASGAGASATKGVAFAFDI